MGLLAPPGEIGRRFLFSTSRALALIFTMASHNEYPGYVKLPKKKLRKMPVRLDFNARINTDSTGSKWEGFSLRLFTLKRNLRGEQPELSVDLRPEEWLDLIDTMKKEFKEAEKARRKLDKEKGETGW